MRLALLILLLLPAAAQAAAVIPLVAAAITSNVWIQVALTIAMTVYGSQQARRAEAARREAQRAAYNASLKDRLITRVATDAPHRYVYGRAKVGSDVIAILTSGDKDQYKHLVCVHAAHECDGFEEIYVGGKALGALDGDGNVTGGDYTVTNTLTATEHKSGASFTLAYVPTQLTITRVWRDSELNVPYTLVGSTVTLSNNFGTVTCSYQYTTVTPRVRVRKHLGTASDTADASLLAECPDHWDSNAVLRGFCYTVVRLDLNQPEFQSGIPDIQVLLRGKKLYDPRSGLTAWSENNALAVLDYLTSEMCGVPYADLPEADYITAANVCDEDIGGGTKRYTFSGDVTADQDQQKVLETMAQSMAGNIVATTWSIAAGKYTAPVMALDFDDGSTLVGALAVSPGVSDADLYNGVRGQYASSENGYVSTDFKPWQNAAYVAADGRELWQNIDFPYTDSVQRVHNLCRIFAEDQRNSYTIKGSFSMKCWKLKVGQRVTLTSAFLGVSGKVFRVMDRKYAPDTAVELTLKEDDASIWDLADAVSADSTPNTNLPNPFAIAPPATLTCSSGTGILQLQADGTVVSRILAEWPQTSSQAVATNGMIEVEWQRFGTEAWQKVQVSGSETGVYLDPVVDKAFYTVRARTVNAYLNVKSDWVYATHQVIGKTAPPSDATWLVVQSVSALDVLTWDQSPDLDVRVGGKALLRHSPALVGAAWESSTSACQPLPGAATAAVLPLRAGTYFLKFEDSLGLQSQNAVSFVSNGSSLFTYTSLGTIQEDPVFSGTFSDTYHDVTGIGDVVELVGAGNIDDAPDFDAITNFDYYGGVIDSGYYDFAAGIDLGSVVPARLTATLRAFAENVLDNFDDRATPIDEWLDFDGTAGAPVDAWIEVRSTNDNPSGTPTWGAWQRLAAADFTARAFQFRARLTSADPVYNIEVDQLRVKAEAL